MSDRLAVMNAGRIEQVGTPAEVYEEPGTPFVAGFVGTSNMLTGDAAQAVAGSPAPLTIRPEKIRMIGAGSGGGSRGSARSPATSRRSCTSGRSRATASAWTSAARS